MIPEKDQYIRCWFRIGIIMEGFVESWSDNKSVLRTHNKEIIIIQQTATDIVAVTILPLPAIYKKIEKEQNDIKNQIRNNLNNSLIDDKEKLDSKKIKDLKILLAQQDKEIVTAKIRNHYIGETKKVEYGYPGIHPKQSNK